MCQVSACRSSHLASFPSSGSVQVVCLAVWPSTTYCSAFICFHVFPLCPAKLIHRGLWGWEPAPVGSKVPGGFQYPAKVANQWFQLKILEPCVNEASQFHGPVGVAWAILAGPASGSWLQKPDRGQKEDWGGPGGGKQVPPPGSALRGPYWHREGLESRSGHCTPGSLPKSEIHGFLPRPKVRFLMSPVHMQVWKTRI